MSKNTSKRGFVAPQPHASAGIFAERLGALRNASHVVDNWKTDPANQDASEADLEARSNAEDDAHDALIGTPAQSTVEVADKVNALFRRWTSGKGDLSNAQDRRAVAAWPDTGQICDHRDYGQSLLALYLDLTGLPSPVLGEGLPQRNALLVRTPVALASSEPIRVLARVLLGVLFLPTHPLAEVFTNPVVQNHLHTPPHRCWRYGQLPRTCQDER